MIHTIVWDSFGRSSKREKLIDGKLLFFLFRILFLFFIYSMEPENKYSGVSIKQFNVELGPKSWKPRKIPPPTTKLSNT